MTVRECPHCGANSHFTNRWTDYPNEYNLDRGYHEPPYAFLAVCDACGMPICGIEDGEGVQAAWPVKPVRVSFPDVPPSVEPLAREAHICLGASAYRAALVMARAVVEATAKDKDILSGKLIEKIDALCAQGFIREHIKEAAHELRHLGNEVAHGDLATEPISEVEAAVVIGLMDEILVEVYQSPARVARVRASRLDRKAVASTERGHNDATSRAKNGPF